MDDQEFWRVIENTKAVSLSKWDRAASLKSQLGKLSDEDLLKFNEIYLDKHGVTYTLGLWGAAYVTLQLYQARTGRTPPLLSPLRPSDPTGIDWDEDDLDSLYPRLSAIYATGNLLGP